MPVLGVDACRAGWVGVVLSDGTPCAHVAPTIGELVTAAESATGHCSVVAVDIPIGLPDDSRRVADDLARAIAGPRRSSVFITPVRQALLAEDHATASAINRASTGDGVSVQAYGLRAKVLEVDEWLRSVNRGRRVVEVHPELSFAALAGHALDAPKSTWTGLMMRRQLLAATGITLGNDLGEAGRSAAADDVLDAAAAAWSASRCARGEARCLPEPPEVFSDGLQAAIWT